MRLKILFFVAVGFFSFALLFHKSYELDQDLGRHLLSGQIIWTTHAISKTNLFSYTYPNFPFINTHWLSEVIFFLVSQKFSLNSLVFLSTLISGTAIVLTAVSMLLISENLWASILSFVILSPVLLERTEVRPEMFSYLFIALFVLFTILVLFKKKSYRLLYFLPLLELVWVNSHIYFILGPAILFVGFLVDRKFFWPLLLTTVAMLLNPNGLSGAVYPLTVFRNYGYTIVENQNIFYLLPLIKDPSITFFEFGLIMFGLSWLIRIRQRNKTFIFCLLMSVFIILPLMAVRSFPFFYLILGPVLAWNLAGVKTNYKNLIIGVGVALIFLRAWRLVSGDYANTIGSDKKFGSQIVEQGKPAVDFVLKNNLAGPVFNNFDIGSYLDYSLFPDIKVFVDGRPEAYPAKFFQNIYIPMQMTTGNFKQASDIYKFKTIIFSHTDQTPWGRQFLTDIIKNKDFKLVYLDDFMCVFVSKDSQLPALDLNNFSLRTDYPQNLANIFDLFGYPQLAQRYYFQAIAKNPNLISKSSLIFF